MTQEPARAPLDQRAPQDQRAHRAQRDQLDRLGAAVDRHRLGLSTDTAIPRLTVISVEEPIEPDDQLYEPMICFISDGAKRTTSGDLRSAAGTGEMLLNTIDLPVAVELAKVPYRAAVMRLDGQTVTDLLIELDIRPDGTGPATASAVAGLTAAPMTPELLDAVTRWVELLDTPEDIPALAPRIESEILYRLLRSALGPSLRQWSPGDSATNRVRQVARWICERYTEPLSIDAIAAVAHMSPASLHRHFKATTGMSPLRYQKHLRLQAARRRLLAGDATAAQVAQAVGYVSATQFNREYRSAYGLPPGQDAARLRARLTDTPTGPT
ncbi:AraC family transcriptional regulator [Streptomyces paludis]|uniref:AraC family transcriptional regulator n=1 Tax=Streptomyces paludis TaxID=2282738 RepID=A0A345HNP2_9ACTN|nr:AraC family transcriptional regulator [Streptomyces paludis]AXG78316.1 AraC family transcriptional regulator [Streptomyces paludis]